MPSADPIPVLAGLLARVPGSRGALVLDAAGAILAQTRREGGPALEPLAPGWHRLVAEALAAADRIGRPYPSELVLETEGATLAVILLKDARRLCLLVGPEAPPGRGLFEARKTAATLSESR
jgi:hypothetical protein